jgi:hypothetical protein
MKRLALLAVLLAAGCGGSDPPLQRSGTPAAKAVALSCDPPSVHRTPYPGGDARMSRIPWIQARPREHELAGLLWYWPENWHDLDRARIFTGGVAPAGYNAKVLWAFLAPSARGRAGQQLVIEGRNLDGPGKWRGTFGAISYAGQQGAPSYASSLVLPAPGCWRLRLRTGELRATVDVLAVDLRSRCRAATMRTKGYPGVGDGTWIKGSGGLTASLGYWPEEWRGIPRARVYTRGRAPGGMDAKVMFAFHGAEQRNRGGDQLVLVGHNLDGAGTVRDSFAAISYEGQRGAPSYAAILDLPEPGCWRITVATADLRGTFDIQAVD